MSPFYTPIFERGWVKKMIEEGNKNRDKKELEYESEESENPEDDMDVNT